MELLHFEHFKWYEAKENKLCYRLVTLCYWKTKKRAVNHVKNRRKEQCIRNSNVKSPTQQLVIIFQDRQEMIKVILTHEEKGAIVLIHWKIFIYTCSLISHKTTEEMK